MAKFLNIIIMEILEFIYREGGDPKTWYIGVTNDPRQSLFEKHQVHYQNDAWIYRTATSEGEALQAQAYFLEYGLVEDEEGWQPGTCAVYAYRKHTAPGATKVARIRGNGHKLRHRSIISVRETRSAAEK